MMSDTFCGYDGKRDEMIVAYVYGELAAGERAVFARHLTRCLVCQSEIEALSDLRVDLAEWSPPHSGSGVAGDVITRTIGSAPANSIPANSVESDEHAGRNTVVTLRPRREPSLRVVESVDGGSPVETPVPGAESRRPFWRELPAWAQFAAAMLFVGVSAGLANFQVTYNGNGLMVRTGWTGGAMVESAAAPPAVTAADLTVLSDQLRDELRRELRAEVRNEVQSTTAAAPMAAAGKLSKDDQDDMVRRVRALLKDSEQRQQRELALRIAEVAQDTQAQRQADLVRIDRTLGALQNTTGTAVRRQEQLLNNLAVRVSQRQ